MQNWRWPNWTLTNLKWLNSSNCIYFLFQCGKSSHRLPKPPIMERERERKRELFREDGYDVIRMASSKRLTYHINQIVHNSKYQITAYTGASAPVIWPQLRKTQEAIFGVARDWSSFDYFGGAQSVKFHLLIWVTLVEFKLFVDIVLRLKILF